MDLWGSGGSHKEWWLLQKEQWASHSRLLRPWKRKVRAWEEVIRILGCGREKEDKIPIYIGTIDCCHLQGRYPKSKKCSINSFQRSFRCNIHNFSMINTAWAISIQTVPFEKNHSVYQFFSLFFRFLQQPPPLGRNCRIREGSRLPRDLRFDIYFIFTISWPLSIRQEQSGDKGAIRTSVPSE